MIKATDLNYAYDKRYNAINDLNMFVPEGAFYGLIGPNGAGKSTLIKLIMGLKKITTGSLELSASRSELGVVPQELALFDDLSVLEHLQLYSKLYKLKKGQSELEELIDNMDLNVKMHEKAKHLSGGMKRRVNLLISILHEPRLLLLDEPTVGVDPQSKQLIFEQLIKLNKRGATILFASHHFHEIESYCNRIAMLDKGTLLLDEDINGFKNLVKREDEARVVVNCEKQELKAILDKEGTAILKEEQHTYTLSVKLPVLHNIINHILGANLQIININYGPRSLEEVYFELLKRKDDSCTAY